MTTAAPFQFGSGMIKFGIDTKCCPPIEAYETEAKQEMNCLVCFHAGRTELAKTHTTLKEEHSPDIEEIIKKGHWELTKELGKTTNCPTLMATVCTNPLCFNGENGLIRFPMYGHSRSYCPCKWPDDWEDNKELQKTGLYNLPSQYKIGKEMIMNQKNIPDHNKEERSRKDEPFKLEDFIKIQTSLEDGTYNYSKNKQKKKKN